MDSGTVAGCCATRWRVAVVVLLAPWLWGCATPPQRAYASARPRGPAFSDPMEITLIQRQEKALDAFGETLRIRVGDITGGQVLVEVASDRDLVVDQTSMRVGDAVSFTHGGRELHLAMLRLANFLVGEDFAVMSLSTEPPPPTLPPQVEPDAGDENREPAPSRPAPDEPGGTPGGDRRGSETI